MMILIVGGIGALGNATTENLLAQKTAVRVMLPLLRPFHPGLSQIMKASILFDTADQTYDMSAMLRRYRLTLTRLEDWARSHRPSDRLIAAARI